MFKMYCFLRPHLRGLCTLSALSTLWQFTAVPPVWAIPKSTPSILPLEGIEMGHPPYQKMSEFLLGLTTYQDDQDANHYYFVPHFKAVEAQGGGAGTVIVNERQIQRRQQIAQLSQKLTQIEVREFLGLQNQYLNLKEKLLQLPAENKELKNSLTALLLDVEKDYRALTLKAQKRQELLPSGVREALLDEMADVFGLAGFSLSMEEILDTRTRTQKLGDLSRSYGGIMSINIHGHLSPQELALMREYHSLRQKQHLPQLKVSLLPVQNFKWQGLMETLSSTSDKNTIGIPPFRNIAGAGNWTGATINLDLTLDGAEIFSLAPPPFVLPIRAQAQTLFKYPSFHARLDCDFNNEWILKGRTDIKDGLVIYNNDIFSDIISESHNHAERPCHLEVLGGGGSPAREAAYAMAVEKIKDKLENIYLERINTTYQDRMNYWREVQTDLQSNRHRGGNSEFKNLAQAFAISGWTGVFVRGMSAASDFYWHTNWQNIRHMDSIKFSTEFTNASNTWVDMDLAVRVCLSYRPDLKRYVGCQGEEEKYATTATHAREEARNSCPQDAGLAECQAERVHHSPTHPETGSILPEDLPEEI